MPKAVRITLTHEYLGEIERIFSLPAGMVVQRSVSAPNPGGANPQNNERDRPANPNNPGQPDGQRREQR